MVCVLLLEKVCTAYVSNNDLVFVWTAQVAFRCLWREVPPLSVPSLSFSFCLLFFLVDY